jgi:hypothetical protein
VCAVAIRRTSQGLLEQKSPMSPEADPHGHCRSFMLLLMCLHGE